MPENVGAKLVSGDKGKGLDALGKLFGAVVGGFYRLPGTRPIKDLLHGTWLLRHPLHPAVTDAVVGGLTVVAVLDVIWLVQRSSPAPDVPLARATDIALAVSLAFAVVSILSGYTDWNETYGNERRLGILHGTLMSLVAIGYGVSLWMRVAAYTGPIGSRDGAVYLALALWVVLAVVAHLGGEMVFGFGTGVNRHAWSAIPSKWQKLALVAATLEDRKPVRVPLKNGFPVMVVQIDDVISAIGAVCGHAGGPLDEGELVGRDRRDIKCPWHGSVFSVRTGTVLHGPATVDQPRFETRVAADGTLEVRSLTPSH
jgi:nitrite reductase/ring-hydroxylating ferredoxin subunit/uncharacterized membrane protein